MTRIRRPRYPLAMILIAIFLVLLLRHRPVFSGGTTSSICSALQMVSGVVSAGGGAMSGSGLWSFSVIGQPQPVGLSGEGGLVQYQGFLLPRGAAHPGHGSLYMIR